MIVAVDATARLSDGSESITELFEAGRIGKGACDPQRPHASFVQWFDEYVYRRHPDSRSIRSFVISSSPEPTDERYAWQVLIGERLDDVQVTPAHLLGTVSLPHVSMSTTRVRSILQSWGVTHPVGVYTVHLPCEE